MTRRVGVLALQGGYAVHSAALRRCGYAVEEVRTRAQLGVVDGLVLPGGESTTHLKLLNRFELEAPLDAFIRSGKPILATCAGLILASTRVTDPEQPAYGWLDVDVQRNRWGRQVHSFQAQADASPAAETFGDEALPLMFIRAPRVTRVGADVSVLATVKDEAVLLRQGAIIAATFHPELTQDLRVHRLAFGP